MVTTPSDIRSNAAAAPLEPSRPAPPTAAASVTVSTGDVDGTSSATSNIMSDEMMAANKSTHIVTGRARHPQSHGVVERVNAQYKTGLLSWMQEKNNEMSQ